MEPRELRAMAKYIVEEMESKHNADMAYKWEKGNIKIIPGDSMTQEHEFPIEKLMHKIVMVRDNLRVLEQQINSNKTLSSGEKLKFQHYVSKCYGSLTSFNFIFYSDEDKFHSK